MKDSKGIADRLLSEIKYLQRLPFQEQPGDLWSGRMDASLKKFLKGDRVDEESVRNFRRDHIFISELPSFSSLWPVNWILGERRGQRRSGKERWEVLRREGDLEYLKKYPINPVGNPYYFEIAGYRFNERWSRHIHYLRLAADYLGEVMSSGKAKVLDIGGGYGIFSGLLKQEFGQIISGIVEFPEQLLLAYYYLAMNFPDARINTLQEVNETDRIDHNFAERFDFLLIPIHCYQKIQRGVFDVISNFTSLAEMSEQWFHYYMDSDVFKGANYFFTLNRFVSRPTYDTDITVLDYRLEEFHKLLFRPSPLFDRYYGGRWVFFTEARYFTSPTFEFIGKRRS